MTNDKIGSHTPLTQMGNNIGSCILFLNMDHTGTISLTIITEHRQNIWYCRNPRLWGLFEMDLSFHMFH